MLCLAALVAKEGIVYLLEIAAVFTIGSGHTYSFVGALCIFDSLVSILLSLHVILVGISIFNTAFSRDELVQLRCFVNIILWTIMFATAFLDFAQSWIFFSQYNIGVVSTLSGAALMLRTSLYIVLIVVVVAAHCKMRQVRTMFALCSSLVHVTTAIATAPITPPHHQHMHAPQLGCVPVFDIGSQTPACRQSGGTCCCHTLLLLPCFCCDRFRNDYQTLQT